MVGSLNRKANLIVTVPLLDQGDNSLRILTFNKGRITVANAVERLLKPVPIKEGSTIQMESFMDQMPNILRRLQGSPPAEFKFTSKPFNLLPETH